MHKDKEKAQAIKLKMKNPQMSIRDIADKVGLSKSTVHKAITNELGQIKDKSTRIADIIDKDKKLVYRATKTFAEYLDQIEDEEELNRQDIKVLNQIVSKATDRFTLLQGEVTDEKGGLRDLKGKSVDELMNMRDKLED